MPEELLNEIRQRLHAGMAPHDVAEELGRRAHLDYGEICGIESAALRIQQSLGSQT